MLEEGISHLDFNNIYSVICLGCNVHLFLGPGAVLSHLNRWIITYWHSGSYLFQNIFICEDMVNLYEFLMYSMAMFYRIFALIVL